MMYRILPWLLLICALGLSSTAAFYSVVGLSIVFSAVALPVIIMGSFLEISKLVIATYLHTHWKSTLMGLKIYLTSSLVVLSFITSIGIYGLLSHGFDKNISHLEVNQNVISNLSHKRNRYESIKSEKLIEQQTITKDISNLREALSSGTRVEYKDKISGEMIRTTSSSARKTFENQLTTTLLSRDKLSTQIEALNDSIIKLELEILNLQTDETLNGELGVVKYLSDTLNQPLKTIATGLILLLIFVFDPLAICLVIATNHAFKIGKDKDAEKDTNKRNIKHTLFKSPPQEVKLDTPPTPQSTPKVENTNPSKINIFNYSSKKRKKMIDDSNSKIY
jgi:ABC-type transport system involved in multi-copper enzyme maturation permease subunit